MLFELVKRYWQICQLKKSPSDTPYSALLLLGAGGLFYVMIVSQWNIVETEKALTFFQTLITAIFLILSYAMYTYIVLRLFKVSNRFVQTLTCLFACHAIIHIFAYPLLFISPWLKQSPLPDFLVLLMAVLYLVATIGLTVWQFLVTVYIYKTAMDLENVSAILTALGFFAMNVLMISILY